MGELKHEYELNYNTSEMEDWLIKDVKTDDRPEAKPNRYLTMFKYISSEILYYACIFALLMGLVFFVSYNTIITNETVQRPCSSTDGDIVLGGFMESTYRNYTVFGFSMHNTAKESRRLYLTTNLNHATVVSMHGEEMLMEQLSDDGGFVTYSRYYSLTGMDGESLRNKLFTIDSMCKQ